jgi:hypothetical protein
MMQGKVGPMGNATATRTCQRCIDVNATVQVGSRSDLEKVLKVVRDNLQDGTIVESTYWPPGQIQMNRPAFLSIPVSGPWPDYLEYYFACSACGQIYRLVVEAYRGFGGSWAPIA